MLTASAILADMPSLREINKQIEAIPHRYVFWTRKEIRALPDILADDEKIIALTSGMMEAVTWLAVGTNKRLIFLHRGMLLGMKQVQLPLDRIQSIEHEYMILFGSIKVWDGASYFTLRMVLKSSIEPFVRIVQEAIDDVRQADRTLPAAPANDIASQLERLATLRDKGVLTDEEFQQQKRKLLQA